MTTILLKTPTVFQLPSVDNALPSSFANCVLKWEQDALIVTASPEVVKDVVPALQNPKWLQECLWRSPVRKVYLDPTLAEFALKAWADLAAATGKQVYLNVPPAPDLPQLQQSRSWWVKRLADWLVAALLLVLFSPLMVLVALLVRLDSPGDILFRQWRVGYQGQLFRICKFRSMYADAEAQHHQVMGKQTGLHKLEHDPRITRVGRWLRKLSLDELPQLINVLYGEMSLVGPRPWALYDAVRIAPELQGRLNALPGITGAWQVSARSNELDLYAVTCRDLAYLQQWTLSKDLKVLLLTIPKVVLGIGAF
ncbi:MAG: heterocyst development glycosyltransferase HepC [Synechococcales bacterium]|nr:heterocyst development glycosyltransferase HepC [Synechococcales bacterium]